MMEYEKLDAWKGCHTLVLATYDVVRGSDTGNPEVVEQLTRTSLGAAAKLAFGSGTRNRKMLTLSVHRSAGFLSEFAYHLSVADAVGVLSKEACTRLSALRGRAAFYLWQLLESLFVAPSEDESTGS